MPREARGVTRPRTYAFSAAPAPDLIRFRNCLRRRSRRRWTQTRRTTKRTLGARSSFSFFFPPFERLAKRPWYQEALTHDTRTKRGRLTGRTRTRKEQQGSNRRQHSLKTARRRLHLTETNVSCTQTCTFRPARLGFAHLANSRTDQKYNPCYVHDTSHPSMLCRCSLHGDPGARVKYRL